MAEANDKSDMEVVEHGSNTRKYAPYQWEIYYKGMFEHVVPVVTTDPTKLEAQARERMPQDGWNYIAGGAGERSTMEANRVAFRQWKIIPRMLTPTAGADLSTTLFGEKYAHPLIIAPIGVQKLYHRDGECGVASVAAELGIPFTMSTAATSTIEEVGAANADGRRWYQLYWPMTDRLTLSLLARAKKAGFTVLVVTLDTFSLSWRPLDLDRGHMPFMVGIGDQVGLSDPEFHAVFKEQTGKTVEEAKVEAAFAWQRDCFAQTGHTWEQVRWLKEQWGGPLVLKGIQDVGDAERAVEFGADGIVVSNHGGRQVDGAIASLDVLPEIVDKVGDRITVLFDSGIRTGADVIKALCLGAKGVLVGRPYAYGLGIAGKEGARAVLRGLLADFDQTLLLSGIGSVRNCGREWLRKVP